MSSTLLLAASSLLLAVAAQDSSPSPSSYSCAGKQAGNYEDPTQACSYLFYSCVSPSYPGTQRLCPSSLLYNVELDECHVREYVPACGGQNPPLTTTIITPQNPTETIAFDCTVRRSGNYAHPDYPCSNKYISCANGKAIVRKCVGDLKYDPKWHRCLEDEYVEPCGGQATPLAVTVTSRPPVTGVTCPSSFTEFIASPFNPCSAVYYACVAGVPYEMVCPANLCYDITSQSCQQPRYVAGCGGIETTTLVATSTVVADPTNKHLCAGHPLDMYFTLVACAAVFLSCLTSEQVYADVLECALNTRFDTDMQRCDFSVNIPECTGLPRSTGALSTTESMVINIPDKYMPPNGYCLDRSDGNYPTAFGLNYCSRYFVTCSGGEAIGRACPLQLSYDPEIDQCHFADVVPACTGMPRGDATESTTHQTSPPVNFDCTNLVSGNYAAGPCSDLFFACVGNTAYAVPCPAGTRYLAPTDSCEQPFDVPSCPHSDDSFVSCSGRPNGFYGMGQASCVGYVLCQNQEPLEQRCFGDQVFHNRLHQCLHREHVPEPCGTMPLAAPFTCDGREFGYYRNVNNCGAYYYCETDGSVWSFECSIGKAFDLTTGSCKGLLEVQDCFTQPPPVLDNFCRRSGDGLFAHPNDCHSAVVCLTGIAFELPCPIADQSMFSEADMDCVANTASCPPRA